jgi:recombination protein RecT
VLGDAAIIARRDRNQGNKKIATFQPMYRGLMRLARSSGQVANMDAAIVYTNDEFDIVRGTEPRIVHRPVLDDEMGGVRGAYAFAKLTSGELIVRYWPAAKLLAHRDRFAKDSKFWAQHPEPMMMKTVVHDLMKYLPLGHTASMAVAVDEAADHGEPVPAPVLSRTAQRLGLSAGDDAENGSGDAQTDEAAADTTKAADGAPDGSTAATDEAAGVEEGQVRDEPICRKPGMTEDSICIEPPKHKGSHQDAQGRQWL